MICNLNGLPDIGFLYRPEQYHGATEFSCLYKYRFFITFVHIGGLVVFAAMLLPMTEAYAHTSALWWPCSPIELVEEKDLQSMYYCI